MKRKVTSEQRQILLDNPELVMFDPYKGFKVHRASVWTTLILPVITGVLIFLWGYFFPDFINSHPNIFAAVSTISLIVASAFLPFFYFFLDDHAYKQARKTHYAKYLKILMPKDLDCNVARVTWVEVQKAEGGWIVDGKEEYFGYCSYVNYFKFEPETDVAFVTGEGFFAYIKRDSKTESFYNTGS